MGENVRSGLHPGFNVIKPSSSRTWDLTDRCAKHHDGAVSLNNPLPERSMRLRLLALSSVVLVVGCTTESPRAVAVSASDSSAVQLFQEKRPERLGVARAFQAQALDVTVSDVPEDVRTIPPATSANMLIRTATASIEVDSLEPAIAAVKKLAARLGGYVANSAIEAGKNRLRSALLEMKIPAPRFEDVLTGLEPIGKLESVNVSAQDVGEEYVDVDARMQNARRLEARFIDLLANRTGKLKDVLSVEEAVARVRGEIERYEGRIRYLKAHTATSTISVTVHEPVPVVGGPGHTVMGDALRQAWRNFVVLASLGVQSLGVVIPLGLLAITGWLVRRRWRVGQRAA